MGLLKDLTDALASYDALQGFRLQLCESGVDAGVTVVNSHQKVIRKSNPEGKVVETRPARLRCAIYTRKSTEEELDQEFNPLDAQREAAEAWDC